MKIIRSVCNSVLNAIFPSRCAGCGEIISAGECFCCYCFENLPKTAEKNLCQKCGYEKKHCQCKHRIYHFDGFTAPFFLADPAKKAMYDFKFRQKVANADFFAKQMAISVKTNFHGISFDGAVYVPMMLSGRMKRGYNQSRELAVRISKILSVRFIDDALGCKSKNKPQHETDLKERFKNVQNKYYANNTFNGKTLLLIDDIKTTGATLDECAKQLISAGASRVYCVTGLVTRLSDKKGD